MQSSKLIQSIPFKTVMKSWRKTRYFSVVLFILLGGFACSNEDQVDVSPDFRNDYIQLHECKASAHPAANFVVTWLSPDALPVWESLEQGNREVEFEEGAISIKAQYSDEACNSLESYTVMTKISTEAAAEHGGWRWDYANQEFECINCDAGASCAGCHGGCTNGPSLFCTSP